MTPLAERITRAADRVYLAEQWLKRGRPKQAQEYLALLHDELLAIAQEVDQ